MKYFVLALFYIFTLNISFGQNVNYQIKISRLKARGDNSELLGAQEPTWFLWVQDNGTTAGSINTWQASGCINASPTFDTWWNGTPNQGLVTPHNWFTINNSDATTIAMEIQGHEEDGCGSDCDVNPQQLNPFGSNFCANGDDNPIARGAAGTVTFQDDPPCQWNAYEYVNVDYFCELEIYWEYVAIDPGTIDGNQFICPGDDPVALGNLTSGSAGTSIHVEYQWQQSVGCTGAYSDIAGATASSYDPPIGATQDICYRRRSFDNCTSVNSNEVGVLIELSSTAPTSITSNPSAICGSGNITLAVNGGTLGTGATWKWYNGDPNAGGTIIGSGDPIIYSISTTSDIYVRAEGSCDTSLTTSSTISIEIQTSNPTLISSTQSTICAGNSIDLTVTGGSVGSSGTWAWYDVDPNLVVSPPLFLSASPIYAGLTPGTTTTYYVRAEGCDTSSTAALTINVNTISIDASSITATNPTVCSGSPTTLTANGGTLGTGADWFWYEGGCGTGAPVGSGASVILNPTITTTYFVRAEGTCNNTNCASITILVQDLSVSSVAIIPTATNVCPGGLSVLSAAGGSLGTGASWQWYSGTCGGTPLGSGTTLAVNPLVTTTYFVRAEGTCNSTLCSSVTIVVDPLSTDPVNATATPTNICPGSTTTLEVLGGSLGPGANWEWYENSCGGIYIGSGATINVTPSSTTTYFVRAEGTCNNTNCVSTSVIVDPVSSAAASVTATNLTVCPGTSTTLNVNGGSLAPGDNWFWYEGGCALGASIGSGQNLTVSPTISTVYFVRAEGICGNTICSSISIDIDNISTDPTSIVSSTTSLCVGQSTVLSVSGGSLGSSASWQWYEGSCGGAFLGSGNSISVTPSATTSYFVRAEGSCGNSNCISTTINVGAGVPAPISISESHNNICPGTSSTLTVNGAALPADYTYVWYSDACGAVTVGVGPTIDVSPTSTTTYFVSAIGTCGSTACVDITLNVQDGSLPPDEVLFTSNNFCEGGSTTLSVSGGYLSTGSNWIWYENSCGGTSIGSGTSITVSPTTSTSYYVRAEGGICGNTICMSLQIVVNEVEVFLVPFGSFCGTGQDFELLNGIPSGGIYSGNAVSSGFFSPSLAGVGSHSINYTITDTDGCTKTISENIIITPSDLSVEIEMTELPCAEGGVILQGKVLGGSGGYSFLWNDGSIENPRYFVQPGNYNLNVTDGDNCLAISEDLIISDDMACIEIPNTFTPNNDDKNDTWNLDFTDYVSAKLQVFSRWGRIVFESSDLIVNWNGQSLAGDNLPADTYYYIIELNDGSRTQNGPIMLLR